MLNDASGFDHIYIAVGYTDLRRGIDGLADIVRESFHLDPYTNSIFLFCGRRSDRIKALVWEGLSAGFCYPHIFCENTVDSTICGIDSSKMCG